ATPIRQLAQDPLEDLDRLAPGDEMSFVDDDRRHCMDIVIAPESFAFTYFRGELVRPQHFTGTAGIESHRDGSLQQNLVRGGAASFGEIGGEQGFLEQVLLSRLADS